MQIMRLVNIQWAKLTADTNRCNSIVFSEDAPSMATGDYQTERPHGWLFWENKGLARSKRETGSNEVSQILQYLVW